MLGVELASGSLQRRGGGARLTLKEAAANSNRLSNGLFGPRVLLVGEAVEGWVADGRTKYPKMFAIRAGDILLTYAGFTCIPAGVLVRIECDAAGLYFRCADGNHYLESQRDENDECLGLCHAPLA
jgi:hypothetical protein